MKLRPITRDELRLFVGVHHRHADPPRQAIVKVAVEHELVIVGVGCGSLPSSRALAADGVTIEISRVCTAGAPRNACSMIYGALCRAASAQGYEL